MHACSISVALEKSSRNHVARQAGKVSLPLMQEIKCHYVHPKKVTKRHWHSLPLYRRSLGFRKSAIRHPSFMRASSTGMIGEREREEGAVPLPSHGVTPKIDGDCSLYSSSCCCCDASTSYDVMHVGSLVACICNWLLRRASSPYASLPLPLSPDSIEDGGACRKASGGDGREGGGTGGKRRPIQVASTETDGQADRQWEEERERETSQ